jgi:hypothetical protein
MLALWQLIVMFASIGIGIMGLSLLWFGNTYAFAFSENWLIGAYAGVNLAANIDGLNSVAIKQIINGRYLLIIPLIAGFLVFTRWTRFRWAARYPVAIMSGVGLGAIVGLTMRSQLIGMVTATATNLVTMQGPAPFTDPISAVIMLVGVVTVLTYFLYSITFSKPFHQGSGRWIARVGRWIMLVSAGYLWSKIFLTEAIDVTTDIFIMWIRRSVQEVQQYLGMPPL